MTTFNTKNQAKRKYYYIAGILVLLLIIVSLAFNSFRKSDNCDPNSAENIKSTKSEIKSETKLEPKEFVTIDTNYGQIRGQKNKFNNITVNTFVGIPYAKPPIDALRFERTVPLANWVGVRDALQQPASCLQTDSPLVLSAFRFLNSTSSEDCLYLNVWAPQQEDQFLPVIVYIHGGAFAYGGVATEELDGLVLAAKQDVVVVTIQYRLGIFGFLSFESKDPKGNMGLYDQREALKWIHTNINKFGGDQDLITVVGHGAGAVSTGLHMIATDSKFYFQRTILQGFGLLWNNEIYSQTNKFSKKFMEEIDCLEAPKVKECIKKINVDRLLEIQQEILEDNPVAFGPRIPSDFLQTFPSETKNSFDFQIDFMFGVNSEDDSLFMTTFRNSAEEGKEETEESDKEGEEENTEEDKEVEDSEPVERSTSKPILTITTTTAKPMTTNPSPTTASKTTTTMTSTSSESSRDEDSAEKEETDETEKEDKEETEEGEAEGGEEDGEGSDEEKRRRRKREADEYTTRVVCPLLKFANGMVESNRSVYIYQLNEFSSYHDEIVFAFGYPLKHKNLYDSEEIKFSQRVMKNWAQFATNGDITESDNEWKGYTKDKPLFLKMSISSISSDNFDSNDCISSVNPQ